MTERIQRLQAILQACDVTQAELGELLDLTKQTIHGWLQGRSDGFRRQHALALGRWLNQQHFQDKNPEIEGICLEAWDGNLAPEEFRHRLAQASGQLLPEVPEPTESPRRKPFGVTIQPPDFRDELRQWQEERRAAWLSPREEDYGWRPVGLYERPRV